MILLHIEMETNMLESIQKIAEEIIKTSNKTKEIKINWNDMKSIQQAERQQSRLVNDGYNLVKTLGGLNTSVLI